MTRKWTKSGYLEGSDLRQTFSLLRANDLIWSFVINNYMLGKEPFPFDLLYWNDDFTNMPAEMHRFYLRNMYRDNRLKKGWIKFGSTPIDVSSVKVPSYFISTKEDHIAPWTSTYEGMMLLGGKKRFVLAASGHVAGVINPPVAKKYHYWINEEIDDREHADQWFKKRTNRMGHGGAIGPNGSHITQGKWFRPATQKREISSRSSLLRGGMSLKRRNNYF